MAEESKGELDWPQRPDKKKHTQANNTRQTKPVKKAAKKSDDGSFRDAVKKVAKYTGATVAIPILGSMGARVAQGEGPVDPALFTVPNIPNATRSIDVADNSEEPQIVDKRNEESKVFDLVYGNLSEEDKQIVRQQLEEQKVIIKTRYLPEAETNGLKSYETLIGEMARKYDLPEHILEGLIIFESKADKLAESESGAIGLGQVMPATALDYGVQTEDLYNPEINLDLTAHILSDNYKLFGDISLAIQAYHLGPGETGAAIRDYFGGALPPLTAESTVDEINQYREKIKGRVNAFTIVNDPNLKAKYSAEEWNSTLVYVLGTTATAELLAEAKGAAN